VQAAACSALKLISYGPEAIKLKVAQCALSLVYKAMEDFAGDSSVQVQVTIALPV
jgi:hypothetical protein